MPASAFLFTFVLGLAACGPRVTNQNIDALNQQYEAAEKAGKSLSIKEVESVLGQPSRSEIFPIEMQTTKELQGVRYYYREQDETIELHFIDNKLIRKVVHFGASLPGEAEKRKISPVAK